MATLERNFAVKTYRNTNKDAWAGRKSLPTYRSLFVPFRHTGTKIAVVERNGTKQFCIDPQGFGASWLSDELIAEVHDGPIAIEKQRRKLTLVSCFSWRDQGAVEIVQRIVNGEYKLSDGQIQMGKKGLVALLPYSFDAIQPELDPARVCGIDLGAVIPAVCAVNFGPQRAYLGEGKDVWAARSRFRAERRRLQSRAGLYSKTKNWRRSEKEDNWIQTYYHALTRKVIKFCVQHGCGTIHMEDLSSLRQRDVESEFRRLLWVPSKFFELLSYKAKEMGIGIVKINPRNTSKRCSECGHISKGNRKSQEKFVCEKCGEGKRPVNADYNAARNIALATGDVLLHGYIESEPDALGEMDQLWEGAQEA
ncbi:transposase, IS605 OrfB family [Solidesulfovibrio fructosivorans JJ]]|uniref:Transposase, IS605 OrfB family n=2 Tax=Solidesulfovibrio fructosivorans TaxID=878 RepID=E1JQZ1_SOLFR|nr:transposase, IS605 OrfB family [Solidesulfovibrio fructosivorans JJ]]